MPSPADCVREAARVLRVGGHMVVTGDNAWRLQHLLDPWRSPLLAQLRGVAKRALKPWRPATGKTLHRCHTRRQFQDLLAGAGLELVDCRQLGFGPFTVRYLEVLPESWGIALHRALQRGADLGLPLLRSTASQFVALANRHD